MVADNALAETAILLAGAPRSGTTWLAKIFDSHPDVIYRHEPDEIRPPSGSIQESMRAWVRQTDARTAGKRPFFPKSWQSPPARMLRTAWACAAAVLARAGLPTGPIPDLGRVDQARAVIKSVRLREEAMDFARVTPAGRLLFIARHPCGQVDLLLRGTRQGRFGLAEAGTDMPFDEASTLAFAARHGVGDAAFQALPDAAKYAWSWRDFNESALAGLSEQPNARLLIYEDLCIDPIGRTRGMLDFTGLRWNEQTHRFLIASTSHSGPEGYYAVLRDSATAVDRWRATMRPEDQDAVRAVLLGSPLARHWSDLG